MKQMHILNLPIALVLLAMGFTVNDADVAAPEIPRERWLQMYGARTSWRPLGKALWGYLAGNLRAPDSLDTLCQSPYMPVACSDLINPYTSLPIKERKGSPGDFWMERSPAIMVHFSIIDPMTGKIDPGVPLDFQYNLEIFKKDAESRRPEATFPGRLRGFSDPEKTAEMVWQYLHAAIAEYQASPDFVRPGSPYLPPPRTLDEINIRASELATKYPLQRYTAHLYPILLGRLRNAFTGGTAQNVSTPSAGNYRYYFPDPDKACLEVFGASGRTLERFCYPVAVKLTPKPEPNPKTHQ
jgi:hypothetical protein